MSPSQVLKQLKLEVFYWLKKNYAGLKENSLDPSKRKAALWEKLTDPKMHALPKAM